MGLFGHLQVRLDPWEVDYGSPLPADAEAQGAADSCDFDVEVPQAQWAPIQPPAVAPFTRVRFVDGIRRLEARVLIRQGQGLCHGAFGSYATGCVEVSERTAKIARAEVGRVLALGSGQVLPTDSIDLGGSLLYRVSTVADADVDAPLRAIQEAMRRAEERVARELADDDDTLLVADGPLSFSEKSKGHAVGFIKRLHRLYLASADLGVLARLQRGTRTPLFVLRSTVRFARYTWFVRLAAPAAADSDLSGLARLEVVEAVGLEGARILADATARLLPRFVPTRARDPRSPQNLLPIGALESHLRRHLGHPALIRRRLTEAIGSGAREPGVRDHASLATAN